MYFTYILISVHFHKAYVGITSDVNKRLEQHNNGYSVYTKRYMPWIVLDHEKYKNRHEARIREKYLKSAAGRRWMKKKYFNFNQARVAELADAQS